MVPVVCENCRKVFDVPESRRSPVCPRCGFRSTRNEPAPTVEDLLTGPLLRTLTADRPRDHSEPGRGKN